MLKDEVLLPELKLVGITVRTSNKAEMTPDMAKIGKIIEKYWSEKVGERIKGRTSPFVTFCAYTQYESDEHGEYTYFVGEEVSGDEVQDSDLETITVQPMKYVKFTTKPGKMPDSVIAAWQQIWQMDASDFGGVRAYRTDFEIYPADFNPSNGAVDIFIGIQ